MFKPELSKSKRSIWQTRKTYSETRSEYENIKIKKHLDKHIDVALDYLGQAKSELKKNIDLYDRSSSKKRLKTYSSSSHSKGKFHFYSQAQKLKDQFHLLQKPSPL